jgi:L-threonylcarbamoyladenylate synthase
MFTLAKEFECMTDDYTLNPIINILEQGGAILYPTDTIWGLGCDATNPQAVEKIFDLKERDRGNPFVLLVSSITMLRDYVEHIHPRIETLLIYHKQPLTFIYDQAKNLPAISHGENGSVAIRIPQDDFCKRLIENFGKPLVATSANIEKEPLPRYFGEISSAVIQKVDYVVKHRQTDRTLGAPSVIAKLNDPDKAELVFLRE